MRFEQSMNYSNGVSGGACITDRPEVECVADDQALADARRAIFVMELVAMATGIPAEQIRCGTRSVARAARARQVAMYLAYVAWQWPLSRVGQAFGRDRTTAGYACRLVEDLRDDPVFDARLESLEGLLKTAPEPAAVRLLGTDLNEMTSRAAERRVA
ncbi:MAG: helix-turn-helix domain-containing protein [Asticcacaulis sp.]